LRISFDDNEIYHNIIQLFIVNVEKDIVLATGYYLRYSMNDEYKIKIIYKQPIEFKFSLLE
jgi:hypothetical protein